MTPLNDDEVANRVRGLHDSELEMRRKFEAWCKRNGVISYGPAQMSEAYMYWKGGYLVSHVEKGTQQ